MTGIHLNQDDQMDKLVKRARTDRTAFGELFDQFYPSIFAYTTRRLIVRAAAQLWHAGSRSVLAAKL